MRSPRALAVLLAAAVLPLTAVSAAGAAPDRPGTTIEAPAWSGR